MRYPSPNLALDTHRLSRIPGCAVFSCIRKLGRVQHPEFLTCRRCRGFRAREAREKTLGHVAFLQGFPSLQSLHSLPRLPGFPHVRKCEASFRHCSFLIKASLRWVSLLGNEQTVFKNVAGFMFVSLELTA